MSDLVNSFIEIESVVGVFEKFSISSAVFILSPALASIVIIWGDRPTEKSSADTLSAVKSKQ